MGEKASKKKADALWLTIRREGNRKASCQLSQDLIRKGIQGKARLSGRKDEGEESSFGEEEVGQSKSCSSKKGACRKTCK